MSGPQFFYFDLGNVLLSFSHERQCRQMAAVAGVDEAVVRRVLFEADGGPSVQWQFERGDFDEHALFEHFCRGAGTRPDRIALAAAGCDIFSAITASVHLVQRLSRAGRRLGIMSNTNPIDWRFVSGRFGFLTECFEQAVLSFEAKAMKPDRAIYEEAVRRAGVPAEQVFFTDDRAENVEGAEAAGLDAVLFTTPAGLIPELNKRGVFVP